MKKIKVFLIRKDRQKQVILQIINHLIKRELLFQSYKKILRKLKMMTSIEI